MANHIHYVGPGVGDKMSELDDKPATCEKYPFNTKIVNGQLVVDENAGEVSLTWGVSGMCYVYLKELDRVIVLPTLDQLLAGGIV